MKVYEKHMEGVPHYYLSESRFFKSIMELITCYEHASLSENFVGYVTVHSTVALLCLYQNTSDFSSPRQYGIFSGILEKEVMTELTARSIPYG
jgi:guanine nucleotide exchange factor VAV